MNWFFLGITTCFGNFFTAQVPRYAENLSGPEMFRVADLIAVGAVQEGP